MYCQIQDPKLFLFLLFQPWNWFLFRAKINLPFQSIALTCIYTAAAAAAKSLQSCPTLCDPIDGSPPISPAPGILQARTLEWVAISFSNVWKWKVKVKSLSRVRLSATTWTAAYQAPPSMGFSRQEYWSGFSQISNVKTEEKVNEWMSPIGKITGIFREESILCKVLEVRNSSFEHLNHLNYS